MTDQTKKTATVTRAEKKVYDALAKVQPTAAMRILAAKATEIGNMIEFSRSAYARIEKGDFREVMRLEDMKPDEVEDLDRFNALVERIASTEDNLERMKMCTRANNRIREAIDRWQSKIDRMEKLSAEAGSTGDEMATALVKTAEFKFTVEALMDRGEIITMAHDAARQRIEAYIRRDAKKFERIYRKEVV